MRIALIFRRFGPYHLARLRAASDRHQEVVGIELSAIDNVYAWDRGPAPTGTEFVTVFENRDVEDVPAASVFGAVGKTLQSISPDAVAIPGWTGAGSLAALDWCRRRRVPALLMSDSALGDKTRTWWKETVKRRVLRLYSAALVGGSPHVEYAIRLGLPRERVFTGYDVVDNEHFAAGAQAARQQSVTLREELGLPEQYFLASSRFISKKNLPRLIEAYSRYRFHTERTAWHLVLLGDGPLRSTVRNRLQELDLEHCVHMLGFKQYDQLPAYYGLAKAFIHASTTEQWGLVVNEAMAAGIPVIVSKRCGCTADLVKHGRNGFIFDPYDVSEMASYLLKMASDDPKRAEMGASGREVIRRWTPQTFAENLLKAADAAHAAPSHDEAVLDAALLWVLARR